MTERALKDLGWFDFRAAAWWLGLLYRRPKHFREALEALPKVNMLRAGVILTTHALIYAIFVAAAGRLLLIGGLGLFLQESAGTDSPLPSAHVGQLAVGIAEIIAGIALGGAVGIASGIAMGGAEGIVFGIAFGIAFGITSGIGRGIAMGGAEGIAVGIILGIASGMAAGIVLMLRGIAIGIYQWFAFCYLFGFICGITFGVGEWITFTITEGFDFGITVWFACSIASWIAVLRAYYYPWHVMLLFFAPTASGYRWHPVAWDDMCSLPFAGLDRFLLALWDASPEIGEREIERLISSYPSQRMEALKARAAAIAREAGASTNLARLDEIASRLPEGEKRFLAETPRVREVVAGIAEAQRQVDSVDRPFLREPYAEALVLKIEAFRSQISGFHEPLASEFRKAADIWLKRAQEQLEQIKKITGREPTPQVFRAGDPVDRSQEAFVPRLGVIGQVERQSQ